MTTTATTDHTIVKRRIFSTIARKAKKERQRRENLLVWTTARRCISGRRFSLDGHEYLRELYDASCREQHVVIMKASQMGATEYALSRVLWFLDTEALERRERRAIFFFPTDTDVSDFSADRLTRAMNESDYLCRIMSPEKRDGQRGTVDRVKLRTVRGNPLYFRGMQSARRVKAIPADMLVFDELDEAPRKTREQAEQRIGHSDVGWLVELSTPTYPNQGIHVPWQRSDQRHWHLQCKCSDGCCLEDEFPACVDDAMELRCPKCHELLDRQRGAWIPHAESDIVGYHLTQLFSEVHNLAAIVAAHQSPGDKQTLQNHMLGLPHVGAAVPFPRELILRACDGVALGENGKSCVMGMDVGSDLHVWIAEREGDNGSAKVVWLGTVPQFEDAAALMDDFDVRACVVDAAPEMRAAADFAESMPGRVHLCRYVEGHLEPRWDDEKAIVSVDRTGSLDTLRKSFLNDSWRLPSAEEPIVREAVKHFACVNRVLKERAGGTAKYRYVETGPDHHLHAANYLRLALDRPPAAVFAEAL